MTQRGKATKKADRPETVLDPTKRPDYIAYGSEEHRVALGLAGGAMVDDARRAEIEERLANAKPSTCEGYRTEKTPINAETYAREEPIMDGWRRVSGRR